ncbi:hypothetical protein [Streptococcus pantholopis]|uniref:Uncharacterized protein n=1 Tax=Streptococcus pantholopis TaxID=1811193 RepID=A0A172Q978_9STRE|nr:hypothetical protein [Streptococcus pantholopis]AND80010.1 hypothetical protein A0O21_08345 [Streptococcus pantholopis]
MKKQTLFNATLEESMNLVTDKYIQTAMEDINEKGYKRKILGFFTMIFFMLCMYWLGIYTDSHLEKPYFINTSILMLPPLIIGVLITCHYLFELIKVKQSRILSYYYYNKNMLAVVSCFALQAVIYSIIGSSSVLGNILGTGIYGLLFIFIGFERYRWFKEDTLASLYGQQDFNNPLARFLDYFVIFSKKYGGLVVLLLFLLRLFLPGGSDIYHNDIIRNVVLIFFPLPLALGVYFVVALGADNFQGYYLQKYLEDYREMSGYSIEEWYGPKSKKYKESLRQ